MEKDEPSPETTAALAKLREPFPAHQISKLPKETRAQIDKRKIDKSVIVWKCKECSGAHHKDAEHLDYVGHAALTDRLLDTDIGWGWEPLASDEVGLPRLDRNGDLWIKLTVCGVTRLGCGSADGKTGGNATKEMIGDAMRNAAMRFGAALDLWHKGDLHLVDDDDAAPPKAVELVNSDTLDTIVEYCEALGGDTLSSIRKAYKIQALTELTATQGAAVLKRLSEKTKDTSDAEAMA